MHVAGGAAVGSMRKSFKDSLKILEADIQHANTLYVSVYTFPLSLQTHTHIHKVFKYMFSSLFLSVSVTLTVSVGGFFVSFF